MRRVIAYVLLSLFALAACHQSGAGRRAVAPAAGAARSAPARRLVASWSTTLAGGPGGVAADRDGSVVVVDDDSVVALDGRGRERWETAVPGAGLGWPLLGDGTVVVPTLRDESGPGGCVALDRESGARRWAYEEPASQGVAVARAGPNVVCVLGNGVVVAIDRASGTRRWRAGLTAGAVGSSVSVAERTALAVDVTTGRLAFTARAGSHWFVETLDLATGADRGTFDFSRIGPVSAPVSTAPGVLAVGASASREVCPLELRRGRVGSCIPVPVSGGFDPASIPLVAGGLVVIAGRDGSVTAIDLAARKVRWSVRVPNPILGARPVLVDGVVVVNDWTRVPWAIRLADGAAVELPGVDGWVVSAVADSLGGLEVAKRNLDGGWIERWVPRP